MASLNTRKTSCREHFSLLTPGGKWVYMAEHDEWGLPTIKFTLKAVTNELLAIRNGRNSIYLSRKCNQCLRELDDEGMNKLLKQGHRYKKGFRKGKKRPIDKPTRESKAIQRIILGLVRDKVSAFLPPECSSKRGKSHSLAVQRGKNYIEAGYCWHVKLDIESFYPNIDHKILRRILRKSGLFNPQLIALMLRCLSLACNSDGKGIPIGAPLSPLMANLYLFPLTSKLSKLGYAYYQHQDDFGIFLKTEQEAISTVRIVSKYLENKLIVPINKSKTSLNSGESYTILGFEILLRKNRWLIRPSQANINELEHKVLLLIEKFHKDRDVSALLESLNRTLKGWANAFKISTDARPFKDLDNYIYSAVVEAVYYAFPHYSQKCAALALLIKDKRLARKLASMNPERALEEATANKKLVSLYDSIKSYRKPYKKAC